MASSPTRADGSSSEPDQVPAKILRAAIECMRRFGSSKMSMADVAKSSGYSRATVYKYFNNRQELIDAVIDMGRAAFFADLEQTARSQDRLRDQMAAAVAQLMNYLHDDANNPFAGMLDPLDEAMITRQLGGDLIASLGRMCTALADEAIERGEVAEVVRADDLGGWLARVLFTAHYAEPTSEEIGRAQDLLRSLCDLVRA